MRKYLYLVSVCLFIAVPVFLPAQTAERIDVLLQTKAVDYDQAAQFVLEAADLLDQQGIEPAQAFSYAVEQNWLPKNAAPDAQAKLDGVSLLVMRSFDVKGGLFYSLFKNPRYAYRELVYQNVIQGRADPQMAVSGEKLLFMVSRILSRYEDESVRQKESLAQEIRNRLRELGVSGTSVRVTDEGVTISIQFLADSAELSRQEQDKISEVSQVLNIISLRKILVAGHTAQAGSEEGRQLISQERAQAVKDYLVSLGTRTADEISVQGYGAARPVADNNTPEGMALNRRVEITILERQ